MEKNIEVIAIGENAVYSVAKICVLESKNGSEVYIMNKALGTDLHLSRHASGKTHLRSKKLGIDQDLGKRVPLASFKGFETFGPMAFGIKSLPRLYKEYKMKEYDGIFAIDMRAYKNTAFNLAISILTEEGLVTLQQMWKNLNKRQVYLYTDCQPMIAITVADVKNKKES